MHIVVRQVGEKIHILVPWHDIHGSQEHMDPVYGGAGLENAPSVYLPIHRG